MGFVGAKSLAGGERYYSNQEVGANTTNQQYNATYSLTPGYVGGNDKEFALPSVYLSG